MSQALFLLNMGGANNVEEVELFLNNMFADKNILSMNRYLRKFVATIIINKRLDEVKENYQLLGGKSPLPAWTQKLTDKLALQIDMPIYAAMRYVPPFADKSLEKCKEDGVEEILLFPMYPQYSTTTTLSSYEDILSRCKKLDYHPKITMLTCQYFDDLDYIKANVDLIIEAVGQRDTIEYDLLLSAHGLPMSVIEAGDPYQRQVESNVSAIKTLLALKDIHFKNIKLVYQSKVGSSAWLEPNLVDVLRNPTNRKVIIYPLAFTIDNSETIFELDIEHREIADKIKYDDFVVAKCMNDSDAFVNLITKYVNKEVSDIPKVTSYCSNCTVCLCCGEYD